jgi:hypothetical protein
MADSATSVAPSTSSDMFGGLDMDKLVRQSMPSSNVNEPKIIEGMKAATAQEARDKAPVYDKLMQADKENLERVHKAADGIQPVELKEWDAKKELAKNTTDPMEIFGSFGFIATQLASAFTRMPFVNGLNAAAGFINGVREHDQQGYEKAYEAFKTNTDIAIKRHNIQREAYDDAAKRFSTDHNAYVSELSALSDKFGDRRTQVLLEGGYIKELEELHRARESSARGMLQAMPQIETMYAKNRAADELRIQGKNDIEIYHELYAPAYSNNIGNFKVQMIKEKANDIAKSEGRDSPNSDDWSKAIASTNSSFNPGKGNNAAAADADEVIKNLNRDGVNLPPEMNAVIRNTLGDKGSSAVSGARKSALVNALEEIRAQKETGDKPMDSQKASKIINDALEAANSGKVKIDQALVNQFPQYDGMNAKKFGYVGVKNQERIMNAIQSSEQIETIAKYAAENPESIGLVADAARKINVDAYKGLMTNPASYITKVTTERDSAIDAAAKEKGLSQDQAAKAKVLNKMLATQAFADAAQAGSRGATIYLDKAFREIYQQASSPPAFFDILRVRQQDSDNLLSKYDMSLKDRKDVKEKFPFYQSPESFLTKAVTSKTPAVPSAAHREVGKPYNTSKGQLIWGGNGNWYTAEEWAQLHGGN